MNGDDSMEIEHFPNDISTEEVRPRMAIGWTNAQVLDALNQVIDHLACNQDSSDMDKSLVWKNYRCVANEIRRRMQANVENFVFLEYEQYHKQDVEDFREKHDGSIPDYILKSRYKTISEAYNGLDLLADDDNDIVFIGVSPEDYMRTWNRLIDRLEKGITFYDEEDTEQLRVDD